MSKKPDFRSWVIENHQGKIGLVGAIAEDLAADDPIVFKNKKHLIQYLERQGAVRGAIDAAELAWTQYEKEVLYK